MKQFKDKSGKVVNKGDIVVYAVAYGRSPGLSYGKVVNITESKREALEKKTKLKTWGVDAAWSSAFRKNTKAGFLEFKERVLVVDRSQVPEGALAILDKIEVETDQEE